MLGQPLSLLLPPVVGFRLTGEQPAGTTATDLVLTITHLLRQHGVVGKFVEFYGPGVAAVPLANRATIGNMSPEYGATCAIFPVDEVTLDYLRFTGRDDEHVDLVEAYAKEQGMFHGPDGVEPVYSETIELDLSTVVPSIAGPARPQDLVTLAGGRCVVPARASAGTPPFGGRPRPGRRVRTATVEDGAVVVAAITSCTNTSNPQVMVAAGLAGQAGRRAGPPVQALGQDHPGPGIPGGHGLPRPGRADRATGRARLRPGRLRLHHLHRELGPAAPGVSEAVHEHDLSVASVLSGNRNFEGRIHPDVRHELPGLSPAGRGLRPGRHHGHRPDHRPLGTDADGQPVFLSDLWPSPRRSPRPSVARSPRRCSAGGTAPVFDGDERWQGPWRRGRRHLQLGRTTPPTCCGPPSSRAWPWTPAPVTDVEGARVLAMLGDSVTTDHISPAGNISPTTPAGQYLADTGVERTDFNSYGARRGNHEVMVRGTFANVRLRNQLAPGTEGGITLHLPDGEQTTIYEAAVRYAADGVPLVVLAGKEYGSGSSRDWAAKGTALLGCPGGHRRELRAHPPLQPDRHGRPPAAVRRGRRRRDLGPDRPRGLRHHRPRPAQRG